MTTYITSDELDRFHAFLASLTPDQQAAHLAIANHAGAPDGPFTAWILDLYGFALATLADAAQPARGVLPGALYRPSPDGPASGRRGPAPSSQPGG